MLLVIEQGGEEEHDESEDEDTDDYESDQGKFECYSNGRSVYYELCINNFALFSNSSFSCCPFYLFVFIYFLTYAFKALKLTTCY